MDAARDLIAAPLRAQLPRLKLVARRPPAAGPLGHNASRRRGQGLEFSQYRAYELGDEPRHIDWKLYARSDRYFVREAQSESGLALWVVLDATASMIQRDQQAARSKFEIARELAAAALEVALRQGDRFGLLCIGGEALDWTPLGRGARHRDRCALALLRRGCRGAWPAPAALRSAYARIEAAQVALCIGDGFDEGGSEFALRLAATQRDVRAIALTGVDERDFDLRGSWVFEDPETGARIETDATLARDDFRARFAAARLAQAGRFAAAGVLQVEHAADAAPARALAAVLDPPAAGALR